MSGIALLNHGKKPRQPHSAPYIQMATIVRRGLRTVPKGSCNFQPSNSWVMKYWPAQLIKPADKEHRGKKI